MCILIISEPTQFPFSVHPNGHSLFKTLCSSLLFYLHQVSALLKNSLIRILQPSHQLLLVNVTNICGFLFAGCPLVHEECTATSLLVVKYLSRSFCSQINNLEVWSLLQDKGSLRHLGTFLHRLHISSSVPFYSTSSSFVCTVGYSSFLHVLPSCFLSSDSLFFYPLSEMFCHWLLLSPRSQ